MTQQTLSEQIQYHGIRVVERRPELIVTHNGKDLTFLYPAYGPKSYTNIKRLIEKDGFATPTMAETVSLVHAAFNSDGDYNKKIKDVIKDRFLCAFTGTLFVPNKGAYVQDRPELRDGRIFMEESELVKKLEENDSSVRFVPFNYRTGEMTPLELARNSYIIALAGEEGAEKLSEVSDKFKHKPYFWALTSSNFTSSNLPQYRHSAVSFNWYMGRGLVVSGGGHGGGFHDGHAFGICNITDRTNLYRKS